MSYIIFFIFFLIICTVSYVGGKIHTNNIKRYIEYTKYHIIKEMNKDLKLEVCKKCEPNNKDRSECWFEFDRENCRNYRIKN